MGRRDIFKVILLPQIVLMLVASLVCLAVSGKLAAQAALVGGVIVMIGSAVSGFIGLGPVFRNVSVAFARILVAEMFKIFLVLFLLAKVIAAAKLPSLPLLAGAGLTLLGTFFSFGLIKDSISPELIDKIKAERLEEERLAAQRAAEDDNW